MAPFTFAVFGDIQNHNDITRRIVDLAAARQPDLCVVVGDLVNAAADPRLWDEADALLAPLTAVSEVVVLPGNHDYEGPGKADHFRRRYRAADGPTYVSLRRGGCRFVLLDTLLEAGDPWEAGALGAASPQLAWLAAELAQGEPTFVFAHHPIFMPQSLYFSTSPTLRVDETADPPTLGNLLPVLLAGGVRGFFAGHLHYYERSRYAGVDFVTTGATGYPFPGLGEAGNSALLVHAEVSHLCVVTVTPERITAQAVADDGRVLDTWCRGEATEPRCRTVLSDLGCPIRSCGENSI